MTNKQNIIIDLCCKSYGVQRSDVLSNRRTRPLPYARQLITYLLTNGERMCQREICLLFGCHRSAVFHQLRAAEDAIYSDTRFRTTLAELNDKISMIPNLI